MTFVAGRPRSFDEEQVLDQAMLLFWRKGYEATGVADLEQATGLGRQSLYGAFGDKRALFLRIVERYFERVIKPYVVDVLDAPGSGRANLERIFQQWQAAAEASEFYGCLVGNSVPEFGAKDSEMSDVLRRKLELMEAALMRALRRAKQEGEVNPSLDTRATARSLLAIAQGLAVVARVNRDPALVRGVLHSARRLLD
ncbi:MAG TPA: TetR/AcrR family transcriptional regulator [Polyangiaceae bacterium]|nr:TetR/AcrR family transcriptional regulator [Polyangiaceae bacterium]